jgi:hypothetical protein
VNVDIDLDIEVRLSGNRSGDQNAFEVMEKTIKMDFGSEINEIESLLRGNILMNIISESTRNLLL